MNKMFLMTRGLPASGKSTWCDRMKAIFGDDVQVVSSDAVRLEFNGLEYDENGVPHISQKNGKKIWSIVEDRVKNYLVDDRTKVVILDATNIECARIDEWFNILVLFLTGKKYCGYLHGGIVCFEKPVDECVRDNLMREDYKQVPEQVILSMYKRLVWEHPLFENKFADQWSTPYTAEEKIKLFCEEGIVVDA